MIRMLATALAVNRIVFGIGYMAAPERTGRKWIGGLAAQDSATVLTRALGARDFALGLGALRALAGGERGDARQWFAAHAIADGADLAATLAARDALPESQLRFAVVMAGASTAVAAAGAASL